MKNYEYVCLAIATIMVGFLYVRDFHGPAIAAFARRIMAKVRP